VLIGFTFVTPHYSTKKQQAMIVPNIYNFILDHRVGGPHVYVSVLRKALQGWVQSFIITTGHNVLSDFSLINIRHFWYPFYSIEVIVNFFTIIIWTITKRIRQKDAVFAVHGSVNLAPILAARILGIPVVWYFHETVPSFRGLVVIGRWVLKGHRHALAIVAHKSAEVYGLSNSVFLPASVDSVFWSPEQVNNDVQSFCKWGVSQNGGAQPLRILAVGNLNPLKGIDILLDALAHLDCEWHLKIVGSSLSTQKKYSESLYSRANEITQINTGSKIDYLGWQEKDVVRNLLATCDIFVLPSRSEACPIALLEAISMRCACVAADVGDVRVMMESYSHGIVFDAGSVTSCYEAISEMQRKRDTLRNIPPTVRSAWQTNIVAAKTEELYKSLLD
jgi:glycosyltransferase involved in cell wall biosynthesis